MYFRATLVRVDGGSARSQPAHAAVAIRPRATAVADGYRSWRRPRDRTRRAAVRPSTSRCGKDRRRWVAVGPPRCGAIRSRHSTLAGSDDRGVARVGQIDRGEFGATRTKTIGCRGPTTNAVPTRHTVNDTVRSRRQNTSWSSQPLTHDRGCFAASAPVPPAWTCNRDGCPANANRRPAGRRPC